tara:strand:- start:119 stop:916 length:798 start_codon:yes stop_codon:yes gene_type:complete
MIYIFSTIFLYLFCLLFLYFFQRKILFNTSDKPYKPSYYGLTSVKEVNIQTIDKISLLCWFFKSKKKSPLLIYFHGNSFNIGERAYRIQKYINKDWSVLLVSWRGYSGNLGKPTEKNLYKDAEATLDWVKNNTHFDYSDLVIYGESLGSGVAVELGTKYKFLSVVLEAPFTSVPNIAQKRYKIFPTKILVKDKFDSLSKIKSLKSPLLVISGKKDEIVPHKHSKILYNEAKVTKKSVFIDEAMHNNLYDFDIENEVINFNLKLWK